MSESLEALVASAVAGSVRAAGRLMTLVENAPHRLAELIQAGARHSREPRLILGVTGAPGSGKSTLLDALVGEYRARAPEARVGVVAVDPSSPLPAGRCWGTGFG